MSNGTAELQAVVESLFFLLRVGRERAEQRCNLSEDPVTPSNSSILNAFPSNEVPRLGDSIIIHPDATYVVGLCNNKFISRENIVLANLVRHLWREASNHFFLEAVWTKAHAEDEGNNLFDRLAVFGTL